MTFGDRVRQAREGAGLTKAELGRRVGISRSAIGQIELGMSKSARAENHHKIAIETGVRAEWLLTGRGPMKEVTNPQVSESAHRPGNNSETSESQTQKGMEVPMTEIEIDLLDAFRSLDLADQEAFLEKVQAKAFKAGKAARNPLGRHAG